MKWLKLLAETGARFSNLRVDFCMEIFVSYITDRFSKLQAFWKRAAEAERQAGAFFGTDTSEELDLGGLVQVIDWGSKRVMKKASLPTPAGFDFGADGVYLAVGGSRIAVLDERLNVTRELSHRLFNVVHSVNISEKGILVSSSGVDSIIEVNQYGDELFVWSAVEHGYNVDPKGRQRAVDLKIDHRMVKYPTLQQATHINSAVYAGTTCFSKETVYASLFHQGQIVAIDKLTKKCEVVLSGLRHPHAVYMNGDDIIFSDTENQKVMLTDKNFKNCRSLHFSQANWIQDASFLSNGNIILADSNNNRILEVEPSNGRVIDEFKYSPEYKVYSVKEMVLR